MRVCVGRALGGTLVGILACGAVMAQETQILPFENASRAPEGPIASTITFDSNLISDPCATCNYSDREGYFVLGPNNCLLPGTTQWVAGAFIASTTGVPTQISAAIILYDPSDCPTKTVTLSIYTDACWPIGPGTPLISAVATVPAAPCKLAVAKLPNAPYTLLTKGTKYWVVATTDGKQTGLDSSWYGSNNAQYAYNLGDGWQHVNGITPALMVEGSGITLSQTPIDVSEQAFGGNLFVDPCTGCNYDSNGGISSGSDVRGPENCNSHSLTWTAVPFVAAKSGVPTRISASIILYNQDCPYNEVTLSLYADNCDVGPGTPLASGIATVPAAPCDLAVAKLRNAPALVQGVKYWVTATTNDQQAALDATWWASNDAYFGVNAGFGWLQSTAGTPGFLVQ
ncbi:MAG TPA: hypothetical protein VFQ78_13105 [Candidatus Udaeobacter sp.]|nr:hypothetical protein [Candidatus Udaeobacter sp.]